MQDPSCSKSSSPPPGKGRVAPTSGHVLVEGNLRACVLTNTIALPLAPPGLPQTPCPAPCRPPLAQCLVRGQVGRRTSGEARPSGQTRWLSHVQRASWHGPTHPGLLAGEGNVAKGCPCTQSGVSFSSAGGEGVCSPLVSGGSPAGWCERASASGCHGASAGASAASQQKWVTRPLPPPSRTSGKTMMNWIPVRARPQM